MSDVDAYLYLIKTNIFNKGVSRKQEKCRVCMKLRNMT